MRCLNCFKEYDEEYGICPHCGVADVQLREPIDLLPGTVLGNRYLIGQSVGAGGFGIIYKAWDLKLENVVAVKEYYPSRLVTRAMGTTNLIVTSKGREEYDYRKARFLAEARNMAKFGAHRNVANVFEYFEENETAYIVMELLNGIALNDYIKENDLTQNPEFALYITNEVGQALIALHKEGIIHRDVAPDNIFICMDKDMKVKLLDLGAAKLADEVEDVIDIVLKPGYSPVEQYVEDDSKRINIDERSDIYALAATLYVMLTGVKPEESTNRKIEDTVLQANELNPNISENLNNAIMKGMAIDKHLRFKNVQEFLQAINGDRKVISLSKEKKRRKIKQITGVAAALIVVGIASIFMWKYYDSKRLEYELNPATITVWYMAEEGSGEDAAMKAIKQDFENTYEGVFIELRAISPEEYNDVIEEAAENGELPTLFESSDVSEEILEGCVPLNNVINSAPVQDCLFLNQYSDAYPDARQMPLGIEIPTACVITNGNTSIEYDSDYFSDLSDFPAGSNISMDEQTAYLTSLNYEDVSFATESAFLNSTNNVSAVMMTSTMDMSRVRQAISGYSYKFVYSDSNELICRFIYEWSIGNGDKDQIAVAERLLSWMLGNKYQTDLMINYGTEGQFPVCRETFEYKISTLNYFAPIANITDNFVFVQYEPSAVVESNLTESEELVNNLFLSVLMRPAQDFELEHFGAMYENGECGICYLIAAVVSCDECYTLYSDDASYIAMIYDVVLHRDESAEDNDSWCSALLSGLTRREMVDAILASTEFIEYCRNNDLTHSVDGVDVPVTMRNYSDAELSVYRWYSVILRRDAAQAEIDNVISAFESNAMTASNLIRMLYGSDEYSAREATDEEFVTSLCMAMFGRMPGDDELNNWVGHLEDGTTREEVLEAFLASQEWINYCNWRNVPV